MSQLQRFKFLALPVLMWTGIAMFAVLFVRAVLEYFLGIVQLNQSIWDYWIPFGLAVVIWYLVLRPRYKLFYNPAWKNNQEMVIFFFISGFLALSIMFGEFAMEYAFLRKQRIERVGEIEASQWNNYYEIDNLDWDQNSIHLYQYSEVTGRHQDNLHYYNYFTVLIRSAYNSDTLIWLGKEYHISISNRSKESYKTARWHSFYERSLTDFRALTKGRTEYLMPVQKSGDLNHYISAIERTPDFKNKQHRVFELSSVDLNKAANEKIIGCVIFVLLSLVACYLISFLPVIDQKGMKAYIEGKYTVTPDERATRDILLMRGEYKATTAIGYLIVVMYILACMRDGNLFHIQSSTSFDYGAMQKMAFDNGEYWRMITSMFSHADLFHLTGNMVLFILLGLVIEPALGTLRFVALIFLSALGAQMTSYFYLPAEGISLGASGFIFGLFGWYAVQTFVFKKINKDSGYSFLIVPMMFVSFFFGMISPTTNNAAHIGGLLAGILLSVVIWPISKKNNVTPTTYNGTRRKKKKRKKK